MVLLNKKETQNKLIYRFNITLFLAILIKTESPLNFESRLTQELFKTLKYCQMKIVA